MSCTLQLRGKCLEVLTSILTATDGGQLWAKPTAGGGAGELHQPFAQLLSDPGALVQRVRGALGDVAANDPLPAHKTAAQAALRQLKG